MIKLMNKVTDKLMNKWKNIASNCAKLWATTPLHRLLHKDSAKITIKRQRRLIVDTSDIFLCSCVWLAVQ